jgi:hypothetical protein
VNLFKNELAINISCHNPELGVCSRRVSLMLHAHIEQEIGEEGLEKSIYNIL